MRGQINSGVFVHVGDGYRSDETCCVIGLTFLFWGSDVKDYGNM